MDIFKFYKGKFDKNVDEKGAHFSPAKVLVLGFAILILVGSLLLLLPISTRSGESIGFINTLFTATSAVCVTGLVVADTNTTWSAFGQVVIILLIQIGGLGIMSVATLMSLVLGRRIGLKERLAIQESLNEFTLTGIVRIFKYILYATFVIELIGAIALSTRLIPMFGIRSGIAKSIFHSISAFCNAGFDILGTNENKFTSLINFNNEPVVLITISLLIILGGLGFIVWRDIATTRKFSLFTLHTKVVLIVTAILVISGAVLIAIFEWNNASTLKNMSIDNKILNAWFHSVTPRTAGYNSLPIDKMSEPSKFLTIFLMFVGGASGSTAGGIKVTTLSVLIIATLSFIKGENDINLLGRRIPPTVLRKSIAITTISSIFILISIMVLLINKEGSFMEVVFETFSAFGTVGLSTGITPALSATSKIQIILTMFLGRVGPLSAALLISFRPNNKDLPYKFPEGKISVG